jgi:archaellum biogenesis ATPase FlaH
MPDAALPAADPIRRASTGVEGLDSILGGGLPYDHMYLLEGGTGTGKTTIGLQFLLEGALHGERGFRVFFEKAYCKKFTRVKSLAFSPFSRLVLRAQRLRLCGSKVVSFQGAIFPSV